MTRRSSIQQLDPELKAAVDAAITEGRATINQIVDLVKGLGGDVSRSAVGRYKQDFEQSLARYRDAQQVAGQWIAQFNADPGGDVGRLLAEMLKTVAFQTIAAAQDEDGKPIDALELSRLSRAVRDVQGIDQIKGHMEAQVAARVRGAVDRAVEGAAAQAKDGRIPAEALKRIREEIYGVVA